MLCVNEGSYDLYIYKYILEVMEKRFSSLLVKAASSKGLCRVVKIYISCFKFKAR